MNYLPDMTEETEIAAAKTSLRAQLRADRKAHVAALPANIMALLFKRPPAPLLDLIPDGTAIGLYHAGPNEAPARSYAKFFQEEGHVVALPRVTSEDGLMNFAAWSDPFDDSDLVDGPFGMQQPSTDAAELVPEVLFVPLIGFSETGARLGQGGGYYDRWLSRNPGTKAIGLAWDCQLCEDIPAQGHDHALDAIVTPTRLYGPF